MSKKLFTELSKALEHDGRDANEKEVADYMNQTFGLIHDITELRLIQEVEDGQGGMIYVWR